MTANVDTAVLLDTMVMSAIVNEAKNPGRALDVRKVIAERSVVVSFVTVAELRFGAINAGWGELRRRSLERRIKAATVLTPDDQMMTACSEFRLRCEQAGHPLAQKVHEADRWIAASALYLKVDLISDDRVFERAPGLSVVRTSTA